MILATDQRPGFDEVARSALPPQREFTLIDIRFDRDGRGVGRVGIAPGVTCNTETRTFELEHYTTQPIVLTEVRSKEF